MSINTERLIELAEWAGGQVARMRLGLPSEWQQADWLTKADDVHCGTACCLAGRVALEDGGKPVLDSQGQDAWNQTWDGDVACMVRFPDSDETVDVEHYATDALGLTDEQAFTLFEGTNTLDDVLRIVGDLLETARAEQFAAVLAAKGEAAAS